MIIYVLTKPLNMVKKATQEMARGNFKVHKQQGLGLAIAKKIIEEHGGSITVESEVSKGAAFTVSLTIKYHSVKLS
jgi:signal transduction histidine kinase